jgi:hypothetical protein
MPLPDFGAIRKGFTNTFGGGTPAPDPNANVDWNYLNGGQGNPGTPHGNTTWTPYVGTQPDTQNAQPDWGPWEATGGAVDLQHGGVPPGAGAPAAPSAPATAGAPAAPAVTGAGGPNDLSQPGAAETNDRSGFSKSTLASGWAQSQLPGLQQPGQFEQFWNSVAGKFNGTPATQNLSNQAFGDWEKNRPDIAKDPGLEAYYKDAEARATDAVNRQAAATGGYGSSSMLNGVNSAIGTMEADRAKNEAQYQLQRDAEIRNQSTLSGSLAQSGDASSRGNMDAVRNWLATGGNLAAGAQDAGLSRVQTGGQVAGVADTGDTSRMTAGQSAAGSAENAQLQRVGQLLSAAMGGYNATSGMAGGTYDNMFGNDQNSFTQQFGAPVAAAGASNSNQTQVSNQQTGLAQLLMQLLHDDKTPGAK